MCSTRAYLQRDHEQNSWNVSSQIPYFLPEDAGHNDWALIQISGRVIAAASARERTWLVGMTIAEGTNMGMTIAAATSGRVTAAALATAESWCHLDDSDMAQSSAGVALATADCIWKFLLHGHTRSTAATGSCGSFVSAGHNSSSSTRGGEEARAVAPGPTSNGRQM